MNGRTLTTTEMSRKDMLVAVQFELPKRQSCRGIGVDLGLVKLDDGLEVDTGRMLMRDQWNTRLDGRLEDAFQDGQSATRPGVRFHKDRMSGLWGAHDTSGMEAFFRRQCIKTLLFTGVNTDQCVLATLQDASHKGFDAVLLKDGCGTRSPEYAKQVVLFNCQKPWGFDSSCAALANDVRNIDNGERAGRAALP